ncbi:lipoate--protein ligase family protein [Ornithinibacillus sp. BX22]|uniref:Octanoyl-[GcvH]:protein N-octanoyltransferase n=2 Tax=Ornithinibacillus TaxID=484508 RepID=A0A923L334_9BACI|nr:MULTISPECIES: lipoate--protein ligase family protein [Ornithinibacillus]MBC5635594.1 lipoate--protein ligase family protein [Ornithinibacillus hominis]MBS3679205.1 lipoate--protein ligase family protein [Ornithinibacillus massiliensis]
MKKWQEIIHHTTFRYIDHTKEKYFHNVSNTALTSFAIDDALSTSVSLAKSPPSMRLWVHPKTIVLGIPDARLPYVDEGVKLLRSHGYQVIVRNSGGLAVALDEGVLNLSLVLPGVKHLSIHECYEAMVSFIQYMLRDITNEIEAYEISESYCPGDYDLSINGKKFAGISQRRVRDGAAIQIYLDIEGNSHERATLIRQFYDISLKGEETKFTYPTVNPNVMESLSNLTGHHLTVPDMIGRVLSTLQELGEVVEMPFSEDELDEFTKRYEQMVKRNEKIVKMQEEA